MTTPTITADNNDKYRDFLRKTLAGTDVTMMSEAIKRVKDHAYKTETIDTNFIVSTRVLKAIEAIKREREDAKREEARKAKQIQDDIKNEFNTKLDTAPPPEAASGAIAAPSRVATREELQNMLKVLDRNYKFLFEQLNGLNDALDVLQSQVKILTDKVTSFEDIINKIKANSFDNKDVTKSKSD